MKEKHSYDAVFCIGTRHLGNSIVTEREREEKRNREKEKEKEREREFYPRLGVSLSNNFT